MSQVQVRQALETGLTTVAPMLDVAWENKIYNPIDGQAYLATKLLSAQPLNAEIGASRGFYQEQGIFQVDLMFPSNVGPGDADTQAELIRAVFYQGAMFTKGPTQVMITRTPAVSQGRVDGDRWKVPIKITYVANGQS